MARTALTLALAIGLALSASVGARASDLIHIDRAWAAPSWGADEPGVLFLRIVNQGALPDRLIVIHSDAAAAARIGGGKPLAAIPLDPGRTLRPDHAGTYIELIGLSAPLESGTTLPLRLQFERAGFIDVEVPVGATGEVAMAPAKAD